MKDVFKELISQVYKLNEALIVESPDKNGAGKTESSPLKSKLLANGG